MDNLFELIIFIVFIALSMIGSLNKDKKKKGQGGAKPSPQYPPRRSEPGKPEPYYGENRNDNYRAENQQSSYKNEDMDIATWNPEESYNPKSKYSVESRKTAPTTEMKSEQEFYLRKMQEAEAEAKNKLSELLPDLPAVSTNREKSKKNSRIQKLIKNPQNLKDYILIADILGKPKALRR